jgi:hypothetical protein
MLSQETAAQIPQIQIWPIDRLIFYTRNPRKNDAAVDRTCSSIREFGFKVPVLARSDGTVVDGHLRLKSARQVGIVARWRHDRNPRNPLRQVVRSAREGIPADGKPIRSLGSMGRRTALSGAAGAQRSRLRSEPNGV